jgi:phosphohistidine swiveling domain-containing protein
MAEPHEPIWFLDDEPSERYPLYSRGNVGEVFPHVLSPLGGSLIGDDVAQAQLDVFRDIGFATDRDAMKLTGVFGGYLYNNASFGRVIGVRTPGMKPTDADEQIFGTLEGPPPYRRQPGDRNLVASARVTRFLTKVLRHPDLTPLDEAKNAARAWLASSPDLATATDDELLAFVRTYPARLADSMKRLLWYGMIAAGPRTLLERLLDRAGFEPGTANRLVGGIDDIDSTPMALRQWELGRLVAADPDLGALFDEGLDGLADRLHGTALADPLTAFLDDFGHRGNDEYELASSCWAMDPQPVLAAIDRLRHAPAEPSPTTSMARLQRERAAAEAEVRGRLRPPLRSFALRAASVSRAGTIGRERSKDVLVLENFGARRALHELTRRAAARGGPADARHGFSVTFEELPHYLTDPAAFTQLIGERVAREQYLNDRVPPAWFEGHITDPSNWPLRSEPGAVSPTAGAVLTGLPVSGGTATGRARLITDPGDPRGLEPGEVLVCAITDPSWTPLFLVASAVVCSSGAALSHAAIVARELGIPAVMSVSGITSVADGTALQVDGDAGTVRVC